MKVFVTGGGGFLGLAIAKQLVEEGYEAVAFSRAKHEELERTGIVHHQGDLSDFSAVKEAMRGCGAVFHVAAKTGIWGSHDSFYKTNVTGTANVLEACLELRIRYLVYTSSASAVYQGSSEGKNEHLPYPKKFDAFYPQTKAIAEQLVLKANGPDLVACSLRPHLVWGPGDPHFMPRLLERQRRGLLRLPGRGQYLVDVTYVDNAARAHLQALKTMLTDPGSVAGKAYFLSQDEPITIEMFINRLMNAGGLPPVSKTMNPNLALFAGWLCQNLFRLCNIKSEPPLTVFLARQLSSSHWYDIAAAKRDLGYKPVVSIDEGMEKLREWIRANDLLHLPDA